MAEKLLATPTSKKKATRGKHINLHRYWKGIAATFIDKAARRAYLNMMIDATVSEHEAKTKKHREKDNSSDE